MFGIFIQEIIAQGSSMAGAVPALGGGAVAKADWYSGLANVGIMAGAVLIPFILSKFLSTKLKMPTHLSAFYWIILSVLTTSLILVLTYFNLGLKLKWGPEIVGGTNLIYEIDRSTEGDAKYRVLAKDFMVPLTNRLNPSGTKELLIRPIGEDQIEIVYHRDTESAEESQRRPIALFSVSLW